MKFHKTGRILGTAALAAGLALSAAACDNNDTGDLSGGKSDSGVDAKAAVATSLEKLEGKTYTMDLSMGDYGSGSFEVDLPNKAQHATMDIDASAIDPSAGDMGAMSMEMIMIDTDIWVKMTGGPGIGMGDNWMHTSTDQMDADMSSMDMSQMTKQMMDSLDDVKSTGDNTYTATMNLDSLAETFGNGGEQPTDVKPFEVKITLNDDQLLQKMEFDIPGVLPDGKDMPMAMEITGYDVEVNVEAPPADQVTNMNDLTGTN